MRISEQWLREWVAPRLDTRALADRLTLAGLEVSAIEAAGPTLEKVVVGEVLSVSPHPDADKLRNCTVAIGSKRHLGIVCGAANVAVGQKVPTALVGAKLPNGADIERSEIRGVPSEGMLCSVADLGLADSSDGLWILDSAAPVGKALRDYLALDDSVFEIDLTPNRADCLSVAGIAREVAALSGTALKSRKPKTVRPTSRRRFKISLKAPADGPHYVGRIIENINAQAHTPVWMQERLRRSGIRSIHPVVDVTNYVMLELGQPMHAFDVEQIDGDITVRHSREGEMITLLDGTERKLDAGTLVIADARRPLAIAGIMGGAVSAVSLSTCHILLESAYFRPGAIAGRARSLGIQTESSHRFERGVDPALQRRAAERATELILAICGGRAGPICEKKSRRHLPRLAKIILRRDRMKRVLGAAIADKTVERILKNLDLRMTRTAGGWRATVPSFRFDIRREEDLIEEVARVHGYDNLPIRLPSSAIAPNVFPETQVSERRLRTAMIDRDFQEVVTYSFVDPALQSLIDPQTTPITLLNPIASDLSVMRTSLWPGLLQTLRYNLNRQQTRVRLFEVGRHFHAGNGGTLQPKAMAGLVYGSALPQQWGVASATVDFFDIKGDVEMLLGLSGRLADFSFERGDHPALHPGQSARIAETGQTVGWVGMLHPNLLQKLDIADTVGLFELDLARIMRAKGYKFSELSKFPSVRCDLAVVVDERMLARTIMDCVQKVAGKLLVNLELFDEYRGEGIDSGRKSLALALTLQDSSRTLKEADVEAIRKGVVSALETKLGARLRG